MRVVRWLLVLALPVVLCFAYMFVSAYRAGLWLDVQFHELEKEWNAEVLLRNIRVTGSKKILKGSRVASISSRPSS